MSKIKEWMKLSTMLKKVKKDEMNLRKDICADILINLPFPAKKIVTLDGIEIKAENGINRNLDDAMVNQFYKELSDEEKGALKFTPALKAKEYKKLPKDSLLHDAVTEKPSAPTLTIL